MSFSGSIENVARAITGKPKPRSQGTFSKVRNLAIAHPQQSRMLFDSFMTKKAEGGSIPQGYAAGGRAGYEPLRDMAQNLGQYGQGGDTVLAHLRQPQADYLGQSNGYDYNPYTGLPQYGLMDRMRGFGQNVRALPGRAISGIRSIPGRVSEGASRIMSMFPGGKKPAPGMPSAPQMPQSSNMPAPPPMPPRDYAMPVPPPPPPMPGAGMPPIGGGMPAPPPMPSMAGGMASLRPVGDRVATQPRDYAPSNPLEELQQRFASGTPILQSGRVHEPEVAPRSASGGAGGYGSVMADLQNRMRSGNPMLQSGRSHAPEVPGPAPLTGFPALMQEMQARNKQRGYAQGGNVSLHDAIRMLEDGYY